MKKKNKLLLSVLGGISTTSILATGLAVGLNNNMQNTQTTVSNGNNEATSENVGQNTSDKWSGESFLQTSTTNNYEFKLTRTSDLSNEYKLEINQNNKKEGTIYFVGKDGKPVQDMTISPGQTFRVGVNLNKGYETYTVRDLKVYGVSESHTVPSKQVEGEQNLFEVKLPTIEESTNLDGTNWLYGNETPIKVIPTFIVSSIGNDVNWEHGAYYDDLNGYVYNLTKDAKWSEIKSNLYNDIFDNDKDKTNPITIYFYLNGHTLTIDEDIKDTLSVGSGWSLRFYNNKYETDVNGKYGKITATDEGKLLSVKGSVGFGRAVHFKYIVSGDGIKILDLNDNKWLGALENNPEQK